MFERYKNKKEQQQRNYKQAFEDGTELLAIYKHFWEVSSLVRGAAGRDEERIPMREWLEYFDVCTGVRSKEQEKLVQGMKDELTELAFLLGYTKEYGGYLMWEEAYD